MIDRASAESGVRLRVTSDACVGLMVSAQRARGGSVVMIGRASARTGVRLWVAWDACGAVLGPASKGHLCQTYVRADLARYSVYGYGVRLNEGLDEGSTQCLRPDEVVAAQRSVS